MRWKYYFLALFIYCSSSICLSQVHPQLENELNTTLDSMRSVLNAKSLSAAIETSNGSIWAHATGSSSNFESVTPNHVYLIGSVTKTITAACIVQLADEGILHLDDSLFEWLPSFPYIDSTITIRQLLNHTSGIYDVLSHPNNQDSLISDMSRIWSAEELINTFIAPPYFQAGTSWAYSNTNYFLLGMIIETATGQPFFTALRNRFFTPLNLESVAIPAYENVNNPVAHCWMDITGDNVIEDAHNFYFNYLSLNSTAGAAGGYYATPTDIATWTRRYFRGDLISDSLMNEVFTVVNAPGSQGGKYGLGVMKNQNNFQGYLAYGHGGDLAYHASSWYFPALDQSITVFTNDNTETSWTLLPVVRELLKTYLENQTADATEINDFPIEFYPNPTSEWLRVIGLNEPARIRIHDLSGQLILQYEINNSAQNINLSTLDNGIYFLTCITDSGRKKEVKIIKK